MRQLTSLPIQINIKKYSPVSMCTKSLLFSSKMVKTNVCLYSPARGTHDGNAECGSTCICRKWSDGSRVDQVDGTDYRNREECPGKNT